MRCIGIDLSWTARRPSGFALIDPAADGLVQTWTATLAPAEVAAWLDGFEDAVVGVDAPLVNRPGRTAEAELARALGRYGVTAYGIGNGFLERRGLAAGPQLGELLAARGWSFEPPGPGAGRRFAFETFPRALILSLLGAAEVPPYKRGRLADRAAALATCHDLLEGALAAAGMRLDFPLPAAPAHGACPRGRELKAAEDRLDAAICAFAAWQAASRGLEPGDLFGSAASGLIVVPGAGRLTSARGRTSP
jgi:predicted RNase H-like nuclease